MDLWQLHVFCKVVETRSFSKAGMLVHLSQPTVSSHIKDLETHLSCRLIDRLSKQAVATKAGEILYRYALRLLSLRDEAETAVAEFQGKIKGVLAVGGSTIPASYLLPKAIGHFKLDFPDVTISMSVGDTDAITRAVLDGHLELGIVGAKPLDNRAVYRKLFEDELCIIVPQDHPWHGRLEVSLTDLAAEPFIMRENGSGTRRAILAALGSEKVMTPELNVVAEMGSTEAICQGIKHGIGLSILSLLAVREDIERGGMAAVKIAGIDIRRGVFIVQDRQRSTSPLANTFKEYLIKSIAV
jgi:DNA-binding transcriptional LysR family regulator